MQKVLSLLFLFLTIITSINTITTAQPKQPNFSLIDKQFEGIIKLVETTSSEVKYYSFWVKNNLVRFESFESNSDFSKSDNYMLFDLTTNTIIAVKPSQKLYVNLPPQPYVHSQTDKFEIIKTDNFKRMHNYNCYQLRVRNREEKTEISYWIAKDNFLFFEKLLTLWNRAEKNSIYFLQIPKIDGCFPMLCEENNMFHENKLTLKVLKIEHQTLDSKLFYIPKDFNSFSR